MSLVRLVLAVEAGCAVVLHLLVGLLKAACWIPFCTQTQRDQAVRIWCMELLRVLRVQTVFRGYVQDAIRRRGMTVANHVSWIDVCLLNCVVSSRFVAKAEVRAWPCIGLLARRAESFFLRRDSARDFLRVKEEVAAALRSGDHVTFFAEGTTTDGQRLLQFRSGLVEGAVEAGAYVCPAAIRYRVEGHEAGTGTPVAFVDDMTFLGSLGRILMCRGVLAEVTYAPPISTVGRTRRQVAAEARNAISRLLQRPAEAVVLLDETQAKNEVRETQVLGTA